MMLLQKITQSTELPVACLAHKDIQMKLQRKNSKHDYAIAFEGMSPGEANAAKASRDKGMPSHAQVQRRMTKTQYKRNY